MKGVNTIAHGRSGAEIQISAPSLRFAIKLGERTSMYRAAALSARNAKIKREERRQILREKIVNAKKNKELSMNINNILPNEILSHVFSFFRGCSVRGEVRSGIWGVGGSVGIDGLGLSWRNQPSPLECQGQLDKLPISRKKESVKYLRRCREVCKVSLQFECIILDPY